mmetsp:Transcript_32797/g.45546  ORF Transcript_32797/g.45546 Transcript_32797/m.45546 type:complete len:299 (+) Transcript_32797:112-1008(+)
MAARTHMIFLIGYFVIQDAVGSRILQQSSALGPKQAEGWQTTPEMPKIAVASGVVYAGQGDDSAHVNHIPGMSAGQHAMNTLSWQANGAAGKKPAGEDTPRGTEGQLQMEALTAEANSGAFSAELKAEGAHEEVTQEEAPVQEEPKSAEAPKTEPDSEEKAPEEEEESVSSVEASEGKKEEETDEGNETSGELLQDMNKEAVQLPSAGKKSKKAPLSDDDESEKEKLKPSASEVASVIGSSSSFHNTEEFHMKRQTMNAMTDIIVYSALMVTSLALPVAAATYIYRICCGPGSRKSLD